MVPFKLLKENKSSSDKLIYQRTRLEKLGLLPVPFPVVLVGGTNGKGSVTNLLSQIFIEAGYRVGTNTSPHLIHFRERFQLNRKILSEEHMTKLILQIESDFENFPLGYAEYSFLLGLYGCLEAKVDLGVFEIGLGGRLDPANLLEAEVSVITNIDFDHTEILGNTLEAIATEKAGIIKAQKPIVCGQIPCPQAILEAAEKKGSPLYLVDSDFASPLEKKSGILPRNKALAIQAASLLQKRLPFSPELIPLAIQHTSVPGRLQELPWKFPLLLDVCHNPGGVKVLAEYLRAHPILGKNIALFAASPHKDFNQMIETMIPVIDEWQLPQVPDLSLPQALQKKLPQAKIYADTKTALQQIEKTLTSADRLIVFGSFYLVGETLCALGLESLP